MITVDNSRAGRVIPAERSVMFIVYWRDKYRNTNYGYIKARTHDEAYDFALKKLDKDSTVTAVYRSAASEVRTMN